jgi:hypothetical protein
VEAVAKGAGRMTTSMAFILVVGALGVAALLLAARLRR